MLPDPRTGEKRPWTRATTLSNTLKETYGLDKWANRMVVLGLAAKTDLYDLACASDPEDKKQLDRIAEDAKEAANAGARARQGTTLHKFTERLDAGEDVRAPAKVEGRFLTPTKPLRPSTASKPIPRMLERITVVPELEVAGTMDKVVKHNGAIKILDLKTGGSVDFSSLEIAMQLAIYAHGEGLWNMDTEEWDQMPAVSQTEGLVIHLPAGGLVDEKGKPTGERKATLYSVDIALGWEIAKVAYQVREWRKNKELLVAYVMKDLCPDIKTSHSRRCR